MTNDGPDIFEKIASRAYRNKTGHELDMDGPTNVGDHPEPDPHRDVGNYDAVPPQGSLRLKRTHVSTGKRAELKDDRGETVLTIESKHEESERTPPLPSDELVELPCKSGWHQCKVMERPWNTISHIAAIGVFRLNDGEDYPVTRAWSSAGVPFALYDGRNLQRPGDFNIQTPADGFLLADEPGSAWLQDKLPRYAVKLEEGTPAGGWGLTHYPYSGVRNVLVTADIKGLYAGILWTAKFETVKRFGGMPVLAFPAGNPAALAGVDWRDVMVRMSDKTRELVGGVIPLDVPVEGLK